MISPPRALFAEINSWVFDLDNTLYPFDSDLFSQVDRRMTDFISHLLKIDWKAAKKIQKDFYRDYGTTLKGLMHCYHINPEAFLTHVHDIDYSWLKPDVRLRAALDTLQGRKFIFTNGSKSHAERACERLGIVDLFDGIFDITQANYHPKPEMEAYTRFLHHFNINPQRAVMFEDLEQNLATAKNLKMRTVLVAPDGAVFKPDKSWQKGVHDQPYIDFMTKNLPEFLEKIP